MDLLKLLNDKADYFSSEDDRGVSRVVSHIQIAEKHYENGKSGEDYLFNDVIYRSNQAFEGVLKEAYRIIKGKNPDKVTPYAIENYFEKNKVLKERVLKLFTNYRTEWRNKSTHDYTLYFTEQEAFLAIVNISAFINILLDQMIQKRAYDNELLELKESPVIENDELKNKPLIERVKDLLISYSKEINKKTSGSVLPTLNESEIIGSLTAYIISVAKDISVKTEYSFLGSRYRADFYLESGNEKLIIEIKSSKFDITNSLNAGTEQLINYLAISKTKQGIIYIPPLVQHDEELKVEKLKRSVGGNSYEIIQIFPINRYSN